MGLRFSALAGMPPSLPFPCFFAVMLLGAAGGAANGTDGNAAPGTDGDAVRPS
jgi:hypothetical protein